MVSAPFKNWHYAGKLLLVLALTACSGPTDTAVPGRADTSPPPVVDAFIPPVVDQGMPPGQLGRFGDPCTEASDCLVPYCIESPQGERICSRLCGDCPQGFECAPVVNDGADRIFICVFDRPELCKPCDDDRDCDDRGDLCLDIGPNTYCGEDCSDDGYCPEGYECAVIGPEDEGVRQCKPSDNQGCQPCMDTDGDGYGDGGDCLGFDCDDTDPTIHLDAPELCDGIDNNCNSMVDEPTMLVEPPIELNCLDVGVCEGSRPLCAEGEWRCNYPDSYETPVETRCDGLDNDCDGAVDDDIDLQNDMNNCGICGRVCAFPNGTAACVDGQCGLVDCSPGHHDADGDPANGCEHVCVPTNGGIETCDDIDNDCNGIVDDGIDLQDDPANCGACGRVCRFANAGAACVGGACVIGECQAEFYNADADPTNGCEYNCVVTNNGIEICDGLDNDCSQVTPDGAEDVLAGAACDGADADLCPEGQFVCMAGDLVCNDQSEDNRDLCDGMDNDCDETTADGDHEDWSGQPCDGDDADLCPDGVSRCVDGDQTCTDDDASVPELCDGLDNDCNQGTADGSDEPNLALPCDGPDSDVCTEGVNLCVGGRFICTDSTGDDVEVCDGEDNDCDGVVDNAPPAQLCPLTAGTSATTCNARGECAVAECAQAQSDVDGFYANGCECLNVTAGGAACAEAVLLGAVNAGGPAINPTANLPEIGESEWFQIRFPTAGNRAQPGTPTIRLSAEADPNVRFQVFDANCQQLLCQDGVRAWTFVDNQSALDAARAPVVNDVSGEGVNGGEYETRNTPWPSTIHIRVYRTNADVSCSSFRLNVGR